MKLTLLLTFLTLLNAAGSIYSQSGSLTLSLKNATVLEVFNDIENQSKFKFFYQNEQIDVNRRIDINVEKARLEDILANIFANENVKYRVFENNLVVLMNSIAQQNRITGTVVSGSDKSPMPGVNIVEKGTTNGVTTDGNGKFSIAVERPDAILIFSFVGYHTKEVAIEGQSEINVTLDEDVSKIEEIVVVGYGVQKRTAVTGAISPVSSKEITQLAVSSVQSALQGHAAGVSVVNNGGPGTDAIVRIRGIGSITYAANPLYVIDGTPANSLSSFDSRDIESVEVLKDASATAIYGSRAGNGVILITTKKGKKDNKVHINLESYMGSQRLAKKLDLLNTEQYLQYANALNGNAGLDLPERIQGSNFDQPIYEGATQTYRQTNTDWQDELFRKATINDNNLSFSTGGEKSTFFASAGYFKQDGIMVGTGFKRTTFRFNSEHDVSKRIKVGQTFAISYGDRDNMNETQGRPNIMHMIRSVPYLPVTVPEGAIVDGKKLSGGYRAANSGTDGNDADNPVKIQKLFTSNTGTTKLFGTFYLELKIFEFLKFRTNMGLDYENIINAVNQPIYYDGFNANSVAVVRRETFQNVTKVFTNQLTFEKQFGNHNLNIIAVQEQTPYSGRNMYTTGNLKTNSVKELTGLININANGGKYQNTLLSYLGRFNYDFKGKYLLSASMRADGSSKFATGNKWGYFPSASVGWRVSKEGFMKNIEQISELKLRAGYGELGNNGGIGNYAWKAVMNSDMQYVLNNATVNATYYNALDNPNLQWETSKMTNIGLDLGLLKNKIYLSVEYFNKITDNLILNLPYDNSIGYLASYPSNVGKMSNKGMEFQLTGQIDAGALKSSLSANLSFIKNKVLNLSTPQSSIDNGFNQDYGAYSVTRTVEGRAIQSFYGWETDGLFQTDAEAAASGQSKAAAGDIRFKDNSGDGIITDADRTFLGSYLPKFSYGLNYTGTYKNVDFTLFFQGVYGNKIYNGTKVLTQGMLRLFNAGTEVLDAWTPTNTNTDVPRAISGDPNQNARSSDRFIESGSYLRLKSLTIGYTIPSKITHSLAKGNIAGIRIFVTGQNLLTFTKYSGYDPEVGAYIPLSGNGTPGVPGGNPDVAGGGVATGNNGVLNNGVDFGSIPQPRAILGGIQLSF
jgi:TonB-dependent starch-binding outer membrane protein SusC